jgi:hypothetical protein
LTATAVSGDPDPVANKIDAGTVWVKENNGVEDNK